MKWKNEAIYRQTQRGPDFGPSTIYFIQNATRTGGYLVAAAAIRLLRRAALLLGMRPLRA